MIELKTIPYTILVGKKDFIEQFLAIYGALHSSNPSKLQKYTNII